MKRIALSTIVAWLGLAALDAEIWEMSTISAQTEQANSVTRGTIFHLFVLILADFCEKCSHIKKGRWRLRYSWRNTCALSGTA